MSQEYDNNHNMILINRSNDKKMLNYHIYDLIILGQCKGEDCDSEGND